MGGRHAYLATVGHSSLELRIFGCAFGVTHVAFSVTVFAQRDPAPVRTTTIVRAAIGGGDGAAYGVGDIRVPTVRVDPVDREIRCPRSWVSRTSHSLAGTRRTSTWCPTAKR
jgi:hypothetical protein